MQRYRSWFEINGMAEEKGLDRPSILLADKIKSRNLPSVFSGYLEMKRPGNRKPSVLCVQDQASETGIVGVVDDGKTVPADGAAHGQRLPRIGLSELSNPQACHCFLVRVFAGHRWKCLMDHEPKPRDLMKFHTAHKYLLLAHNEGLYRKLGPLVAESGSSDFREHCQVYGTLFSDCLANQPSIGSHLNVLQHLAGFLKRELPVDEKQRLMQLFGKFQLSRVSLADVLKILRGYFANYPNSWVDDQYYLFPYPGFS